MHFTVLLTLLVALDLLEPRELLDRVRDVDASINTTLHAPEHFVAVGDAGDADVQEGLEGFAQVVLSFRVQGVVVVHHVVGFAVAYFVTCVEFVESLFLKDAFAK